MRGQASVWSRTKRLEATQYRARLRLYAAHLATDLDITGEQLLTETEELTARAQAAGAMSPRQVVAFAAAEVGLDPAELWAEAQRSLAEGWAW